MVELDLSLPSGILCDTELGSDGLGRLFIVRDRRLDRGRTPRRQLRILPDATGSSWHALLLDRVFALAESPLPFVAAPREVLVCRQRELCILSDHFNYRLPELIQEHKGATVEFVTCWLEQLLEALAGLHGVGLSHGNVQPTNVFLQGGEADSTPVAWLGEAVVGGLAWWSRGSMCPTDAWRYLPPEWDGQILAPSPLADLFALGLVASEMLLGSKRGNPRRGEWDDRALVSTTIEHELAEEKIPGWLRQFIGMLLAEDPGQRPDDGMDALNRFRRMCPPSPKRLWMSAAGLCLAVILLVTTLGEFRIARSVGAAKAEAVRAEAKAIQAETQASVHRTRAGEGQRKLEATRKQLQQLQSTALIQDELLKQKDEQIQAVLATIELKGPAPADPFQTAKAAWADCLKQLNSASLPKDTAIVNEIQKLDAGTQRQLNGWVKDIRGLLQDAPLWAREPNVTDLVHKAVQEPWHVNHLERATTELSNLKAAARQWEAWAFSSIDVNTLPDLIAGQPAGVAAILRRWYAALLSPKAWILRPTAGRASPGYGVWRRIHVGGVDGAEHDWQTERKGTYTSGRIGGTRAASASVRFNWSAGQPVQVIVEYQGYWVRAGVRPNMIDSTFDGPLALWRMHKQGWVGNKNEYLQFEILNCPGPPKNWKPPLATALSAPPSANTGAKP